MKDLDWSWSWMQRGGGTIKAYMDDEQDLLC